jgi:hypothetical protein
LLNSLFYLFFYSGIINGINILSEVKPKSYKPIQNYLNPFNSSEIIRFGIPSDKSVGNTEVIVYDVLGHEVETLLNQPLNAGGYQVN